MLKGKEFGIRVKENHKNFGIEAVENSYLHLHRFGFIPNIEMYTDKSDKGMALRMKLWAFDIERARKKHQFDIVSNNI